LDAIADAEGVVLDYALQDLLLNLVPTTWRNKLIRSLDEARARYLVDARTAAAAEVKAGLGKLPAQALRIYWQMPEELEQPEAGYLEKLQRAFKGLGLSVMAAQISGTDSTAVAQAVLRWLLWNDLFPAILADGDEHFEVSGLSLRELPNAGGLCRERGPVRLKRLSVYQEWLPIQKGAGGSEPVAPGPNAAEAAAPPALPLTEPARESAVELRLNPTQAGVWRITIPDRSLEEAVRAAGMLPLVERPELSAPPDASGVRRVILTASEANRRETVELPSLAPALLRWRLEALEKALSDSQEPVSISVWTYLRDHIPADDVALSFGQVLELQESEQRGLAPMTWEARIAEPLLRLRELLAARPALQNLRLHLHCPPGVALRVGTIFSHRTGFLMDVIQNGAHWDVDMPRTYQPAPLESADLDDVALNESGEFHVLLSFSQDVRSGYRRWLLEQPDAPLPQRVLHIAPREGVGGNVVPRENVADWAGFVYQTLERAYVQMADERERLARQRQQVPGPVQATRIFCAAPVALATAIGRFLNARGLIITMDFVRDAGSYFESGRFTV
jgi:hypothetical protein